MKTDTAVIENREEAFSTELEDVFESSADEPSGDVAEQQKSEVIIDDDTALSDLEITLCKGATRVEESNAVERWHQVVRKVAIGWNSEPSGQSTSPTEIGDSVDSCIRAIHYSTVHTYSGLRKKLTQVQTTDPEWMNTFLNANGLGLLIEALNKLCEKKSLSSFVDTVVQLECVGCIRAVMNSESGLDYMIDNKEFIRKLASGKKIFPFTMESFFHFTFLKKEKKICQI